MSVDIEKLERLACLKVSDEQKKKIADSIDGVVETFNSILNQELNQDNQGTATPNKETKFRPENTGVEFEMTKGINLVDGQYFIAPKVIKKD